MGVTIEEILQSFEQLSDIEKRMLAAEILRRSAHLDAPPLTDDDLVLNAEAVFLDLDQRESAHESAASR